MIGKGTYTYSNLFKYSGSWEHGSKHGSNSEFIVGGGGSTYTGYFVNGEMTGEGTRKYENGNVYKGNFIAGEREGYGVETKVRARSLHVVFYSPFCTSKIFSCSFFLFLFSLPPRALRLHAHPRFLR